MADFGSKFQRTRILTAPINPSVAYYNSKTKLDLLYTKSTYYTSLSLSLPKAKPIKIMLLLHELCLLGNKISTLKLEQYGYGQ